MDRKLWRERWESVLYTSKSFITGHKAYLLTVYLTNSHFILIIAPSWSLFSLMCWYVEFEVCILKGKQCSMDLTGFQYWWRMEHFYWNYEGIVSGWVVYLLYNFPRACRKNTIIFVCVCLFRNEKEYFKFTKSKIANYKYWNYEGLNVSGSEVPLT